MTAQEHGELDLAGTVATRARGLLAERRMKQAELGLVMGIPRTGINNRLNGAKDFDLGELPALADALDTTVEYLLGFSDVRESKNPRPGDLDGGDSLAVRHQGLEPRTRWFSEARPVELRLIPAPLPDPAPVIADPLEQEVAEVVSLATFRGTPNRQVLRFRRRGA